MEYHMKIKKGKVLDCDLGRLAKTARKREH